MIIVIFDLKIMTLNVGLMWYWVLGLGSQVLVNITAIQ